MRKVKQSVKTGPVTLVGDIVSPRSGLILERLKRLNGFPLHKPDWQTEYFLKHILRRRKRA